MRAIVWFRTDLRVHDHPALHAAWQIATRGVIAVFAICPEQWRIHDWGEAKVDFLLRNLRELSERLSQSGIPLLIRQTSTFRDIPEALREIARQYACDGLFFNREYEVNEQRRDEAVKATFAGRGIPVKTFDDQVIVNPEAVRTKAGEFYSVFSPYRRAWIARLEDAGELKPLPAPRRSRRAAGSAKR